MNRPSFALGNNEPRAPKPATYTTWYNPLTTPQYVDVHEGAELVRYTVPAGGKERIPSRHDLAIHRVQCSEDRCRAKGGFCAEGHDGVVHGGLAPQLRRAGREDEFPLARGLDTEQAAREEAEAAVAAAETQQQRAAIAAVLAQKRADDLRAKSEGAPPAGSNGGDKPKK